MARVLRGDIHWADLNPLIGSEQGSFRPVLILSHNIFNERSGTVIAVAITTQPQRAGYPLTLELSDTKLPKKSWAKISQVRRLSTKRIGKKIASASPEELVSIIEGLNEIIGG
jgi:mRNA interferase MazF